MSCVAWVMTGPDGSVAFHEQFQAARIVGIGMVGAIKDDVHKAIARRLLETVLQAEDPAAQPKSVPSTFDTFEDAVATLPAALGTASVRAPNRPGGLVGLDTGTMSAGWSEGRCPDELDPALPRGKPQHPTATKPAP